MDRQRWSPSTLACLAVVAAASVAVSSAASGRSSNALGSGGTLKSCIDDSDCQKLGEGSKYACFAYICYPWKDDSRVPAAEKRTLCRKKSDCSGGKKCERHHDKRKVSQGLCMEEPKDCEGPQDCRGNGALTGCCNNFCCEEKYYQQYKALPCVTDFGCKDLGLGQFCCPGKGNATKTCCDINPNPPPPPTTNKKTSGAAFLGPSLAAVFLALVLNCF